MDKEKVMAWAVDFVGCQDPDLHGDGVIEAAMHHAEVLREMLKEAREERNTALAMVAKLAKKAAQDGCPREAVQECQLTDGRLYGREQCVACWIKWSGLEAT